MPVFVMDRSFNTENLDKVHVFTFCTLMHIAKLASGKAMLIYISLPPTLNERIHFHILLTELLIINI